MSEHATTVRLYLDALPPATRAEANAALAALLEEHRKEVAALALARDMALAMHEAAQKARPEEQEDHRKALVRARNEGLEKAVSGLVALGFDTNAAGQGVIERIRAMKEPE
jgi:hypothetical protein